MTPPEGTLNEAETREQIDVAKDDDHCGRINKQTRNIDFRTDPQYCISHDAHVCANVVGGRKPRATTVDMIATGTDIRPLECVMFMHDVFRTQIRKFFMKSEGVLNGKSQSYYEQMKGRGTRIISRDELHTNLSGTNLVALQCAPKGRAPGMARDSVTPDAPGKSRFVLVDCVGVTETDKTETKSLETKPSVSTAKLMEQVARGDRHSETLRALGNRMIRTIARKAA